MAGNHGAGTMTPPLIDTIATTDTIRGLFARLEDNPSDTSLMLILADALDEEHGWGGGDPMRWAVRWGRVPDNSKPYPHSNRWFVCSQENIEDDIFHDGQDDHWLPRCFSPESHDEFYGWPEFIRRFNRLRSVGKI